MNRTSSGWVNGFMGIAIFAGSLPATRVAVADLDPIFLTCARAAIAGVLGLALLRLLRLPRPYLQRRKLCPQRQKLQHRQRQKPLRPRRRRPRLPP